jgi:hypothetical protein
MENCKCVTDEVEALISLAQLVSEWSKNNARVGYQFRVSWFNKIDTFNWSCKSLSRHNGPNAHIEADNSKNCYIIKEHTLNTTQSYTACHCCAPAEESQTPKKRSDRTNGKRGHICTNYRMFREIGLLLILETTKKNLTHSWCFYAEQPHKIWMALWL